MWMWYKYSNVKSNNIIYENNEVKLSDLCLNEIKSSEYMVMDEIYYKSSEELSGNESNEKSVIWKKWYEFQNNQALKSRNSSESGNECEKL